MFYSRTHMAEVGVKGLSNIRTISFQTVILTNTHAHRHRLD